MVVDASLVIKWFIPEAGTAQALLLLEDRSAGSFHAPDLIRVEVAGAFLRLFREGHLSDSSARSLISEWDQDLRQQIPVLHRLEDDFAAATGLALQLKHPLQDCFYLALARRLNRPLATADKRMALHAETLQISCHFIHSTH